MSEEIILPLELFDGRFSLRETGTIAVLMSAPHLSQEALAIWEGDDMLKETVDEMVERGIIIRKNNQWILDIDKEERKSNMKIETTLNELYNKGICNEDNVEAIRDVMEELANEFYHLGYEDGRIDFGGSGDTFTAYGKKEDFVS